LASASSGVGMYSGGKGGKVGNIEKRIIYGEKENINDSITKASVNTLQLMHF